MTREARRKFQIEGGTNVTVGGTQNFGDGGTGPHGGEQPLDGVGSPPHTGQPWVTAIRQLGK